jgi:hypothetical protein
MQIIDNFKQEMWAAFNLGWLTSGTNYISGSSVQVIAANSTGTFKCHPFVCKRAVFVNQRSPMYRVYKTDETGLDYARWLPVGSGGWANRVEIDGIKNLNELSIQVDSTATSNVSGVAYCLL